MSDSRAFHRGIRPLSKELRVSVCMLPQLPRSILLRMSPSLHLRFFPGPKTAFSGYTFFIRSWIGREGDENGAFQLRAELRIARDCRAASLLRAALILRPVSYTHLTLPT